MIKNEYEDCEINYPVSWFNLDCYVKINDVNIDVEYDGWYYHQDKMRDIRRDNFVRKQGYKILRVKSNNDDTLPSREQIDAKIQMLLHGWNHVIIQM